MRWFRRRPDLDPVAQAYRDAPRPERHRPWRSATYAVLDLETSGLNARRDAILSVGMIEIVEGRIRLDRCWSSLVRPPDTIHVTADTIRIHGIFADDLTHAPPLADVLPAVLERLSGRVPVVHVATIDIAFLQQAVRRTYGIDLHGPAIDTARLAAAQHERSQYTQGYRAERPTLSLRSLAEQLELPVYAEHDALADALTTAQLFLAQASAFEQQGERELRHLLRAGGCLR